ncbi:MAG: hypothetical protein ABI402_08615 [Ferruginibacter sp.]
MKITLQPTAILLSTLILLGSCNSTKESIALRKADIEKSKEPTTACFIQLNDGTIKNYSSLKLITGLLKTPYLLADGKTKIMGKDIKAYQNKDHYAISQSNFTSGHKSYVATETLPGFAVRIAKGKINVYAKKYYNGVTAVDEYFVQKGEGGQILAYTTENMNMMVKDDEEALTFFVNKSYTTSKSRKELNQVPYNNTSRASTRNK